MAKKSKPATTANPVETETERKGRGRRQVGQGFLQSVHPADRMTWEEKVAARDFYQANAAMEFQLMRISREQGCRC